MRVVVVLIVGRSLCGSTVYIMIIIINHHWLDSWVLFRNTSPIRLTYVSSTHRKISLLEGDSLAYVKDDLAFLYFTVFSTTGTTCNSLLMDDVHVPYSVRSGSTFYAPQERYFCCLDTRIFFSVRYPDLASFKNWFCHNSVKLHHSLTL